MLYFKNTDFMHRGLWPSGRGKVSLLLSSGFEPQRACLSLPRCLTCLLGLQGIQWVRGLVVVRVSCPKHPGLLKKKQKKTDFTSEGISLFLATYLESAYHLHPLSLSLSLWDIYIYIYIYIYIWERDQSFSSIGKVGSFLRLGSMTVLVSWDSSGSWVGSCS
jgi:hypothetical protein